jgi:hypothetical protein
MAKSRAKRPVKRRRRTTKRAAAPARPETCDAPSSRFVRDLLVRGEAAKPDKKTGRLPSHATHVITGEEGGETTVRRVRFKAF